MSFSLQIALAGLWQTGRQPGGGTLASAESLRGFAFSFMLVLHCGLNSGLDVMPVSSAAKEAEVLGSSLGEYPKA